MIRSAGDRLPQSAEKIGDGDVEKGQRTPKGAPRNLPLPQYDWGGEYPPGLGLAMVADVAATLRLAGVTTQPFERACDLGAGA